MAIDDSIEVIKQLLEKVRSYNRLISSDNFDPLTIEDMKGNAKDICNQAKTELDEMKSEIDQWS